MKNTTLLLLLFVLNSAIAQKTKFDFLGAWTLVSVENKNSDGTKTLPYNINPKGALFFDEKGNYAIQIYKMKDQK